MVQYVFITYVQYENGPITIGATDHNYCLFEFLLRFSCRDWGAAVMYRWVLWGQYVPDMHKCFYVFLIFVLNSVPIENIRLKVDAHIYNKGCVVIAPNTQYIKAPRKVTFDSIDTSFCVPRWIRIGRAGIALPTLRPFLFCKKGATGRHVRFLMLLTQGDIVKSSATGWGGSSCSRPMFDSVFLQRVNGPLIKHALFHAFFFALFMGRNRFFIYIYNCLLIDTK